MSLTDKQLVDDIVSVVNDISQNRVDENNPVTWRKCERSPFVEIAYLSRAGKGAFSIRDTPAKLASFKKGIVSSLRGSRTKKTVGFRLGKPTKTIAKRVMQTWVTERKLNPGHTYMNNCNLANMSLSRGVLLHFVKSSEIVATLDPPKMLDRGSQSTYANIWFEAHGIKDFNYPIWLQMCGGNGCV